jgi:GT2 family glycosyltransferase
MKVAIFTLTKDRSEYTERFLNSLNEKTKHPFDHFIIDQASKDNTVKLVSDFPNQLGKRYVYPLDRNIGINRGVNFAVDRIGNYDIIIKMDNDVEIETNEWLAKCIYTLRPKLLFSPYVKGLVLNRGGVDRVGYLEGIIGQTPFIGGICMIGLRRAWTTDSNGWTVPAPLHAGGDKDFCGKLSLEGYVFGYKEDVVINHMDDTLGQESKYPEYFRKRKLERITTL